LPCSPSVPPASQALPFCLPCASAAMWPSWRVLALQPFPGLPACRYLSRVLVVWGWIAWRLGCGGGDIRRRGNDTRGGEGKARRAGLPSRSIHTRHKSRAMCRCTGRHLTGNMRCWGRHHVHVLRHRSAGHEAECGNRSEENVFHCLYPDCIRLRRRDCLEGSFDIGKLGVWDSGDQECSHHDDRGATAFIQSPLGQLADVL